MKQKSKDEIKQYLQERFKEERLRYGLSQSAFARRLQIDVRSYADIEHGESMCGLMTFLIFLSVACSDPADLVSRLQSIIRSHYNTRKPLSS